MKNFSVMFILLLAMVFSYNNVQAQAAPKCIPAKECVKKSNCKVVKCNTVAAKKACNKANKTTASRFTNMDFTKLVSNEKTATKKATCQKPCAKKATTTAVVETKKAAIASKE